MQNTEMKLKCLLNVLDDWKWRITGGAITSWLQLRALGCLYETVRIHPESVDAHSFFKSAFVS